MTPKQAKQAIEDLGWTVRKVEQVSVQMNFETGSSRRSVKKLWTAEKGDLQVWGETCAKLLKEVTNVGKRGCRR